jgi:glycolate oxidase FAD binding subunit
VLGIAVATAEGALVKSGGRVVKNVSGYDLHRMHTGALGTFGVIVEASFKLAPLPPATATFAVQCAQLEQAAEIAFALWDQALPLRALSLLTSEAATTAGLTAAPHVLLECAGAAPVIARCAEAVRVQSVLLRATGGRRLDSDPWAPLRTLAGSSSGVALRLGVPASKLTAAIEAAASAGCTAWAHLAAGSVVAYAPALAPDTIEALRTHARAAGGFLQVEAAPAAIRRTVEPFDLGERALVRALKQQFDPRGTLNRGRWMEGV